MHAQAGQHFQRLAQILHERALGHLQGDELGVDAPALALVDQGIAQIPSMREVVEVHRQVEGEPGLLPQMAIAQRLADDHLGQLIDEAVVFRQRNEAGRRDEAVLRVLPARQRLHADPLAGAEAHLGLIPGQQLILLQRQAQLIQGQAVAVFLLGSLRCGRQAPMSWLICCWLEGFSMRPSTCRP